MRGLHDLDGLVRVEVLTDQPEARFIVGRVGQGAGIGFLYLTAIRGLIEGNLGALGVADLAQYAQEYKPFLEPFDAVISSTSMKDGVNRSRTIITVK